MSTKLPKGALFSIVDGKKVDADLWSELLGADDHEAVDYAAAEVHEHAARSTHADKYVWQKGDLAVIREHFNPEQARVPAGSPEGGQFAPEGGEGREARIVSSSRLEDVMRRDELSKALEDGAFGPQWSKKFDYQTLEAMAKYTDAGYRWINQQLRHGEGRLDPETAKDVDSLDRILNASSLPDDLVVYRGFRNDAISNSLKTLPGTIVSDKGYISTTLDVGLAAAYAKGELVAEIHLPKGYKAAYVDRISASYGEREVLLPRGSRFKVVSVSPAHTNYLKKDVIVLEPADDTRLHYSPDQPRVPAGSPEGGEFLGHPGAPSAAALREVAMQSYGFHVPNVSGFEKPISKDDVIGNNEDHVLALAEQTHEDPDELRQRLQAQAEYITSNANVFVRIGPTALGKVLDSGSFLNQYESERSGGTYDPQRRAAYEAALYQNYQDLKDLSGRPIYGYLASDDQGIGPPGTTGYFTRGLDMYGSIAVQLKDDVRSRTTWTGEDSWGNGPRPMMPSYQKDIGLTFGPGTVRFIPSPLDKPSYRSFELSSFVGQISNPLTKQEANDFSPYLEAQIHGGLKASDIKKVTFLKSAPSRVLKEKLAKAGIPWSMAKR